MPLTLGYKLPDELGSTGDSDQISAEGGNLSVPGIEIPFGVTNLLKYRSCCLK